VLLNGRLVSVMPRNIYELENDVDSKDKLSRFLQALSADSISDPESWENGTIEKYIEAISAYLDDARNVELTAEECGKIASLFLAGKHYE
jgi:hypothetical protein